MASTTTADERPLPEVYLKPGEWHFGRRPTVVATLLGSCVSVTMFHAGRKVGAICHATLPEPRCRQGCASCKDERFQYVICCIREMVARFEKEGMPRKELRVKVFGGADVLSTGADGVVSKTVGQLNVEMAEQTIKAEGLKLVAEDVRGLQGRKLYFTTATGEVLVRRVRVLPGTGGPRTPEPEESLVSRRRQWRRCGR